ncbi:cation-translocating P-type ATPase [Clostridium thermopalmarium]|uniref:Calcium-transporting ATPase 1 n=1 Tax=Clostridium thermopalmarium DSM 5974 TaxID=1121340 RepID=A0A2T0ATF6_9CLOT|nr:cation-translocating P-type ATPase [Clostridium thermopalmarium]PRR73713.1 Calcium-transporting ATPase 1 [Clostridium thermopalmarium DSM 5974]PVZ21027.1 Ca2+-transporting ATPase [Clostridium thermopalmarium DSM 5974]
MKEAYKKSAQEVMESLKVTSEGLNNEEVEKRRKEQGFNELNEGKKKNTLQVFGEQFKDLLVIILLGAAVISMFLGNEESALVIFSVVILNAILGTAQHIKAEKSLSSLKALSAPIARVLRNGEKVEIPSREVVVGDILYLEAGDYVSADGRIIENFSLQVNESSLTGESESVVKTEEVIDGDNVSIGDMKNMVFAGSFVTYGRAAAVVTNIGMDTEIGKVASLLENTKQKKTPLQISLDDFGKKLASIILIISALIFILNMYRGYEVIDSFMFAVALAVAAIPEALSSIVTIVLALGTQKMAKENAIIRKLQAVESLGSVSVICSDKTGTLTQNKMTAKKIYIDEKIMDIENLDLSNTMEKKLVLMSLLCSDAISGEDKEIGDPTEIALTNLGRKYNLREIDVREMYPRICEIPFDSDRKLMSTVHKIENQITMITKGALDVILERAVKICTSDGVRELTYKDKEEIKKVNENFSKKGLRVLAFAYRNLNENKEITLKDEEDLIFVGLISMIDPPREESQKAVAECISAGIKPIMITGDHKITASAIAKQIGILKNEDEAMEGYELDRLSDEELKEKVDKVSVYARVSPEHKIRIVRAWQEKGNVVAMTGDGVNDAPALKQADIGISMGITGTEVAKDAASMVLTDDNFATIVKAISNGRNIYNNIKNSIKFLLSGNTAGIMAVLYAALVSLPNPFAAVHLLFINLLTDSLPAIALGLEPHKSSVMEGKPRNINKSILSKDFVYEIVVEGFLIAACTMIAFKLGLQSGNTNIASTMAFATLCMARLFHGFNCRSRESIFKIGIFSNKYAWIAFGIGTLFLNSVLLFEPLRGIIQVEKLTVNQYAAFYVLAFIPFTVIQLYKFFFVKTSEGRVHYNEVINANN